MKKDFSPCGIVCDDCEWFKGEREPLCKGCNEIEGKAFWSDEVCETYACAEKNGVEHCGECGSFPCTDFMGRFDPESGAINAVIRAGILAYRKQHGDEETVRFIHGLTCDCCCE